MHMLDAVLAGGDKATFLLNNHTHRGVRYMPLYDLYVDALYCHVHYCIYRHINGLAKYDMGTLAHQQGSLQLFIQERYPQCPNVYIISLDRRIEQQVPEETLIVDCAGNPVNMHNVSFDCFYI